MKHSIAMVAVVTLLSAVLFTPLVAQSAPCAIMSATVTSMTYPLSTHLTVHKFFPTGVMLGCFNTSATFADCYPPVTPGPTTNPNARVAVGAVGAYALAGVGTPVCKWTCTGCTVSRKRAGEFGITIDGGDGLPVELLRFGLE